MLSIRTASLYVLTWLFGCEQLFALHVRTSSHTVGVTTRLYKTMHTRQQSAAGAV
jgi:hypothetical protein